MSVSLVVTKKMLKGISHRIIEIIHGETHRVLSGIRNIPVKCCRYQQLVYDPLFCISYKFLLENSSVNIIQFSM